MDMANAALLQQHGSKGAGPNHEFVVEVCRFGVERDDRHRNGVHFWVVREPIAQIVQTPAGVLLLALR